MFNGKIMGKPWENCDLYGNSTISMGHLWKITMLLMGKSTISMAIFKSFLYVYQRVFPGMHVQFVVCRFYMVLWGYGWGHPYSIKWTVFRL